MSTSRGTINSPGRLYTQWQQMQFMSHSLQEPAAAKQLVTPQQQLACSARKRGITEFNQIYKQIPSERERKKFLLQNALPLSKEQAGCRKLQKKLEEEIKAGNLQFCEELLSALIDFFPALMKDKFANYLC